MCVKYWIFFVFFGETGVPLFFMLYPLMIFLYFKKIPTAQKKIESKMHTNALCNQLFYTKTLKHVSNILLQISRFWNYRFFWLFLEKIQKNPHISVSLQQIVKKFSNFKIRIFVVKYWTRVSAFWYKTIGYKVHFYVFFVDFFFELQEFFKNI